MKPLYPAFAKFFALSVLSTFVLGGCASIMSSAKEEPAAPAETVAAPAPMVKDSDNDGVPDDQDACPNTRAGASVDHKGCEIIGKLENTHFEFDSSKLTGEAREILDRVSTRISQFPERKFELAGHTDSIGTDDYNNRLGASRASSVFKYLTGGGIAADQLMVKSYGESKPVASNDTEEGRAMNRRVEIVELGM